MTRGLAITLAWMVVGGAACADEGALKDPKMIAAGHNLFLEKQCAHCHGEDGKGGVNLAQRNLDPTDVLESIADGREKNGLRMPAWREVLTEEEIRQAAAYVMSISRQSK